MRTSSTIWFRGTLVLGALLGLAPGAMATEASVCADAYVEAQKRRQKSELLAARDQLLICARDECPRTAMKDCQTWLEEVREALPTVVISATRGGEDVAEVTVTVDGEEQTTVLDGKPLELDPGEHSIRYELAGVAPVEKTVIIREGEKNRLLEVDFGGASAAEAAPATVDDSEVAAHTRKPIAPFVVGGIGVAALATAGVFWLSAANRKNDLDDQECFPACDQRDVDAIERDRLVGDVLLGVSVAALGTATVLFVTSRKRGRERGAAAHELRAGVAPTTRGGFATLRGRF